MQIVVLGGGSTGEHFVGALRRLDASASITLVERRLVGGECSYWACMPTKTMLRAVQTEFRVAKAREETLLGNVNRLRAEAQELNEKEIQYLNLQRESDSNQQLYEAVLKRLKETGVTGGLETNNVSIVEDATVPGVPVRPRKTVNLVVAILVGLLIGVGTALTLEYFDTTVKTPDDVERHLGLPVIGIVPQFVAKR